MAAYSDIKLFIAQQGFASAPEAVRPYLEELYNNVIQLQGYIEQYLGVTQKEPALWQQFASLPFETLRTTQLQRLYCKAGAAVSRGHLVRIYETAGEMLCIRANATGLSGTASLATGICQSTAAAGEYTEVYVGPHVTPLITGMTQNIVYYLSTTPGLITPTRPTTIGNTRQLVGISLSANKLLFNPAFAEDILV